MKRFLISIAATAALLASPALASSAQACTKVAAPGGLDSADGSVLAPFRTADRLAESLSAGQVGCLRGGTYSSDQEVKIDRPGVTLTSYPGERATLVTRLWVASPGVIVSDLDLRNSGELPSPTISAPDVTFRNNDITNDHTAICFALGNPDYGRADRAVIDSNRIHNCGRMPASNHDHGIYVEAATGAVIKNNWIYDNADRGIQLYPDAQGTMITGNVIDGNGQGVSFGGDSRGASNGNTVTRNVIANSNVRYNVESYYDPGHPVGTNNSVTQNCINGGPTAYYADAGGGMGVQSERQGFSAIDNLAEAPVYVNRSARNFALAPGTACARLLAGSLSIGISLKAKKRSVRQNASLALLGKTTGADVGDAVAISIHTKGGWRVAGKATIGKGGSFRSKVRVGVARKVKTARIRATVTGIGDSRPLAVKVKR